MAPRRSRRRSTNRYRRSRSTKRYTRRRKTASRNFKRTYSKKKELEKLINQLAKY